MDTIRLSREPLTLIYSRYCKPLDHRSKSHQETNVIQQADTNFADDILHIINTSNRVMYQSIISADQFIDPYLSLDDLLQDFHKMSFFVYKDPNRIVGVAALEVESADVGNIQRCYVLPSYQHRGIGTALVVHLQKMAVEIGLRQLTLHVGEAAYWAANFYRKLGYVTIERQEQPWGITLVMTKQL
jgi:N-acetylglutamate synthase-like GNAT family acetyltransferase